MLPRCKAFEHMETGKQYQNRCKFSNSIGMKQIAFSPIGHGLRHIYGVKLQQKTFESREPLD